jgi:hypothetical protein
MDFGNGRLSVCLPSCDGRLKTAFEMKTLRIFVLSFVGFVGLGGMALPALAQASPPGVTTAPSDAPARPRALSPEEAQNLEQREKKAKDLDKYEGGQVVIVISTIGVVIIALIIVLILL